MTGKVQNYYTITEKSIGALNEARDKINELITEAIEERGS
jgi:hypothetical protein